MVPHCVSQRKVELESLDCCWEGHIHPLTGLLCFVELFDQMGRSDRRLGVAGAVVRGAQNMKECDAAQTLSTIRSRIPRLSLPLRTLGVLAPWVAEP